MGEIILSILVGGFLVVSGMIMNLTLEKELRKWKKEEDHKKG